MEKENIKNEKVPPFPYTSGEQIEKHRASLGAQLKNDLQSYLTYQKTQSNYKRSVFSREAEEKSLVGSIMH